MKPEKTAYVILYRWLVTEMWTPSDCVKKNNNLVFIMKKSVLKLPKSKTTGLGRYIMYCIHKNTT